MAERQGSPDPLSRALGFDPVAEGFDLTPEEAAGLLDAAAALQAEGPAPSAEETERLVAALAPFVPGAESRFTRELSAAWSGDGHWLTRTLAAVQPQVRLLRRPFWLASAALVALGLPLLDSGLRSGLGIDLSYGAFLVLVAPVLAALGVAYAFRSAGTGMAEVEMACALTPAQLVLGRLFWVAAYDAALLGTASLAAAGLEPGVRLGWLVLGWLMPMLLLAVLVLALTLYVPPWVGAGAALTVWGTAVGVGLAGTELQLHALVLPRVVQPLAALSGLGALLLTAALVAAAPRLVARLAGTAAGEGM